MIRSLKIVWLAGAMSLALTGVGLAADKPQVDQSAMLEEAFGSTIVSTYPDGRQGELWLQRDGTYTAAGRRQDRSSGHWQVKGDKLCLKQQRPFPAPFSFCTPVPENGLGHPWTGKAYTGEAINIRLVKGMHGRDVKPKKADEQPAQSDNKG